MSEEELKQEKMQALFDYEETSRQLNARRAQAERIGREICEAGEKMQRTPSTLFFSGDSVPIEFARVPAPDPESLNVAKIREICSDIRMLELKLENVGRRKKELGYSI